MGSRPAASHFAAALLAILAAALVASPVFAATSHKPDASIRALTSHYAIPGYDKFTWDYDPSWVGVGVYNTTATGQTTRADWQYGCCNEKHAFSISIRNNGNVADRFKVKATGSG